MVLKHLGGYMAAHSDQCMSLKWKGLHAGVFKQYENEEPMVEIFSDADWAADRETWLSGLLKLQDAENRVTFEGRVRTYAAASATMDAILITTIFSWLLRCQFTMCLYLDSSAARGVLSRKGVGRLRHLQNFVDAGFSHAKTFAGEIIDGSIESCRCCREETQRSKARVVMLLFGYLERKQS